tara:strand:- start:42 stop:815 length:774 start_codon:yes stop_codon:yes gene_type:complete
MKYSLNLLVVIYLPILSFASHSEINCDTDSGQTFTYANITYKKTNVQNSGITLTLNDGSTISDRIECTLCSQVDNTVQGFIETSNSHQYFRYKINNVADIKEMDITINPTATYDNGKYEFISNAFEYNELNSNNEITYTVRGKLSVLNPRIGTKGRFKFENIEISTTENTETLIGNMESNDIPALDGSTNTEFKAHAIIGTLKNASGTDIATVKYCRSSGLVAFQLKLKFTDSNAVEYFPGNWIKNGEKVSSEPTCE